MREIPYNHETGNLPPTLAKVPFLKSVDQPALDGILKHSSLIECDPGDVIIREGDTPEEFFVLLRGTVQVTKSGKEVAVIDSAGELIGELGVLNQEARSATVAAATHAFCLKIGSRFLEKLSDADRNAYYAVLYRFLVEVLAGRLAETSARLAELEQ